MKDVPLIFSFYWLIICCRISLSKSRPELRHWQQKSWSFQLKSNMRLNHTTTSHACKSCSQVSFIVHSFWSIPVDRKGSCVSCCVQLQASASKYWEQPHENEARELCHSPVSTEDTCITSFNCCMGKVVCAIHTAAKIMCIRKKRGEIVYTHVILWGL